MFPPLHNNKSLFEIMRNTDTRGVTILELVIIIAVLTVGLSGVLALAALSSHTATLVRQTNEATFMAQEVMEALRNYRDGIPWNDNDPGDEYDGLGVATASSSYHFSPSSDPTPRWRLLGGKETTGVYTRDVVFRNICRNSTTDNITGITDSNGTSTACGGSGGTHDTDTKEVTVNVSWVKRGTSHEVELIMYLTNWSS